MRVSLVALLCISVTAAAVCGSQKEAAQKEAAKLVKLSEAEWKEFTSKEFGFSAELPGKVEPKLTHFSNNAGEYRYVQVRFEGELITFSVRWMLMGESMDKKQTKAWFASSAEKNSENFYFKGQKEIQLGDVIGQELESGYKTIEGIQFDFWSRTFRDDRHQYSARVEGPKGTIDPKLVRKYLDSLKLLNPGKQTRGLDQDPAKGVLLADSFATDNGVPLATHWMNTGAGWQPFGTGIWRIYDKRARLALPEDGQDVIAADAGAADATLTCDMLTPDIEGQGMDAGLVVRMVDNDNYWLVAYRCDHLEVYKKSGGNYASVVKPPFTFKPKTTYHLKVTVKDKALTAFVNNKEEAKVTMDDFLTATKFGFRDNSVAKYHQPSWEHFLVTVPEK